jgi:protein-disulfide isomerase
MRHFFCLQSSLSIPYWVRIFFFRSFAAFLVSFFVCGVTFAEGISQDQADAILRELKQIHQLLERGQAGGAPPITSPFSTDERVTLPISNVHSIGSQNAPLTLVEFTDVQCPFCSRFHTTTFDQLKKAYIDTGKLRFVSRDLPLNIHPYAMKGANASRCAGEQNKFWEMRHLLLLNAATLSDQETDGFANKLELDMGRFAACLENQKYFDEIEKDIDDAHSAGINLTPTFLLGKSLKEGFEGIKIVGVQSFASFEAKIKEFLSAK